MRKSGIFVSSLASLVLANASQELYDQYLREFGNNRFLSKHYSIESFTQNVKKINEHNLDPQKTFTLGINQFTGVSDIERQISMKAQSVQCPQNAQLFISNTSVSESSWDYREHGISTPVRDQGFQGRGEVHSAIAAFEQHYQVKFNSSTKYFSAQQALDCMDATKQYTNGDVFSYYLNAGGMATEKAYPFVTDSQHQQEKCIFNYTMDGVQILGPDGYMRLQSGDEQQILMTLRQKGPIAVMFQVSPDFFSYQDGVYTNSQCLKTSFTSHGLLIIGYGTDPSYGDFWLVQNSWGTSWGQQGFAKIGRGINTCGIASCATFPINIMDPWKEKIRNFQRHFHNITETGAMCGDGTPAGVYYSKGYGEGANKTIIYFNGGGWCYGFDNTSVATDCYYRTFTNLGSSSPSVPDPWTEQLTYGDWYFSGDLNDDINFYNWNRFFFIYCDGTGHQGYLEDPIIVNNKPIYIRGHNNTVAHLNFVKSLLPIELTDTFVVNGCSAGGLATYTWVDTIADWVHGMNPKTKVYGLPDSGFFVDYPSNKTGTNDYGRWIKAVADLANSVVPLPNSKCVADNKENPHYCLMAEHLVKYIQTPLFIDESLYDAWQVQQILQMDCVIRQGWNPAPDINNCTGDQLLEIHKFRNYTADLLLGAYNMAPNQRSVWAVSCPFHCFSRFGEMDDPRSARFASPAGSLNTLGETSHWFIYQNLTGNFIDQVLWPNNRPCRNVNGTEAAKICNTHEPGYAKKVAEKFVIE